MAYKIPRRSFLCSHGQEPLTDGMTFYSRLTSAKEQEWVREDFCERCWENKRSEGSPFWRGKIASSSINRGEKRLRKEEILEKAVEQIHQEGLSEKEKFVLAIFLKRGRRFHLSGEEKKDDIHFLIFTDRETGEIYFIEKGEPYPSEEMTKTVLEKLFQCING